MSSEPEKLPESKTWWAPLLLTAGVATFAWLALRGAPFPKLLRANPERLPELRQGQRLKLRLERAPVYAHPRYVERMRETTKVVEVVNYDPATQSAHVKDAKPTRKLAGLSGKYSRRYSLTAAELRSPTKPPMRYYVLDIEVL